MGLCIYRIESGSGWTTHHRGTQEVPTAGILTPGQSAGLCAQKPSGERSSTRHVPGKPPFALLLGNLVTQLCEGVALATQRLREG